MRMKVLLMAAALCLALTATAADKKAAAKPQGSSYLFVWAGDEARTSSDFLAVIDANPSSSKYGQIVSTVAVGANGTMPHHTEYEFPADGQLFANGWVAGRTFVLDLTQPLKPRVAAQFTARDNYSFAH